MINKKSWQPARQFDAITFDCDSTLSRIEGIDYLAKQNNCSIEVKTLTDKAMNTHGLSKTLYQKRLNLVLPSLMSLKKLGKDYFQHLTPDATKVIQTFKSLNKSLYVISAGNQPAIAIFAELLGIDPYNTFAVNLFFNPDGSYQSFDQHSPLIHSKGKINIINQLKDKHARILHVGDGMNDIEVKESVSRFIGYGGHGFREKICMDSPFYIKCKSLLPLLPLTLTAEEALKLTTNQKSYYEQGLELLRTQTVMQT